MNLGYACINTTLSDVPKSKRITTNRSMIKKTFQKKGMPYASELALQNVKDLIEILRWNEQNGIKFYRMSSDIFPWMSEYRISDLPAVGFSGDYYHRPAFIHGQWIEFQGCVMMIDPSGKGLDRTAYSIVAHLNGNLFVLEVGSFREGYTEPVLKGLAEAAKRRKVKLILLEDQFGQGMMESLLQPYLRKIYPCTIEPTRSNVQKERRIINALEPVMNQHRLILNRSVIEDDSKPEDEDSVETALAHQLFHQMTHLTVDRQSLQHDDKLDSLAGAVQYWNESLAIDEDRAMKEREGELWELEMAAYKGDIEGLLDAQVLGVPLEKIQRQTAKSGWIKTHGNH